MSKSSGPNEAAKTVGAAAAGAAAGAGIYAVIGGVGVAAAGTAVGVTLGPFIAIGAGVGAAAYGLFWLGKQRGEAKGSPGDHEPQSESQFSYWLNVDYPTSSARVHLAACKYALERLETLYKGVGTMKRDGGWRGFATIDSAKTYASSPDHSGHTMIFDKCRDCLPLEAP